MRSDIQKVICERPRDNPRWGNSGKSRRVGKTKCGSRMARRLDFVYVENEDTGEMEIDELSPTSRPMSRHNKELTDYLTPLKGWLAQQVGRRYDDVYSELCSHLGGNGVMQAHVRQHADDFLMSPDKVMVVDGLPYERDLKYVGQYRGPDPGDIPNRQIESDTLYGDPVDGLVKWGPKKTGGRYGLARYNPATSVRSYQKLPRVEGAEVHVGTPGTSDYKGTLRRRGGKWYWAYWTQIARDPDLSFARWIYGSDAYKWVDREEIATPKLIKQLGYRPEKRRRGRRRGVV